MERVSPGMAAHRNDDGEAAVAGEVTASNVRRCLPGRARHPRRKFRPSHGGGGTLLRCAPRSPPYGLIKASPEVVTQSTDAS